MNRIYHHCFNLEEAPMWDSSKEFNSQDMVNKSMELFCDYFEFERQCKSVLRLWPFSCEHNLTNKQMNRIAWIGQAACCVSHGASELATRAAWSALDDETREECNNIASRTIKEYERWQR